jgi:poly-beta-1,6-N-acetyl-D-glucosamine biosynthesis protein PgaD
MRSLILDQYTQQTKLKRLFGNTLTGLAWAFWAYLWLPLIAAIIVILEVNHGQVSSNASLSILELLATLNSHISTVAIMIMAFLSWSFLQWLGKSARHKALQQRQVKCIIPAMADIRQADEITHWRKAQLLVVSHDETFGSIQVVDILKSSNQTIVPFPKPTIRTASPAKEKQLACSAVSVYP